jgi:hypothetical protein
MLWFNYCITLPTYTTCFLPHCLHPAPHCLHHTSLPQCLHPAPHCLPTLHIFYLTAYILHHTAYTTRFYLNVYILHHTANLQYTSLPQCLHPAPHCLHYTLSTSLSTSCTTLSTLHNSASLSIFCTPEFEDIRLSPSTAHPFASQTIPLIFASPYLCCKSEGVKWSRKSSI